MDIKHKKPKPNIVFILIDDLGWKDVNIYGSEFYETPNIDQLAEDGMRFTNAYASSPVCSPTRASILSGKYPATVGVTDWIGAHAEGKLIDAPYIDHLPLEETSIAKTLLEEGYNTWHVGKWHLGGRDYCPERHGFEKNIGGGHWGQPPKGYFSPYGIDNLRDGPAGEYLTDRLTDEAINLIDNKEDKPFFLNFSHYAVHTPIEAPLSLVKKYEKKAKELGLDRINSMEKGEVFPTNHKKHEHVQRRLIQSNPIYAAMIENLDTNIGRLMNTLKKNGEINNTIIIFTSDNGGLSTAEGSPTTNAPLNEGKGWMYEGGVREPLIIKWPGVIDPGKVCEEPVTSPDFYPTLLEMAGLPLKPKQHIDGYSIVPLLKEKNSFEREAIYWHYPHYGNQGGTPGSSIRMGDYKLIEFYEDGRVELYNLKEDIQEKYDLSNKHPKLTNKLKIKLRNWRDNVQALAPKHNPNYRK